MLAGAVGALEGFLLEQSGKTVLGRHFLDDLHHHQILVDLGGYGAVQRSKLVLMDGEGMVEV